MGLKLKSSSIVITKMEKKKKPKINKVPKKTQALKEIILEKMQVIKIKKMIISVMQTKMTQSPKYSQKEKNVRIRRPAVDNLVDK